MKKIKEILILIDSKYKMVFNKFISFPKVSEVLKKSKVPVDRILNEEKINKTSRYLFAIICFSIVYFTFFSGNSVYRGNELRKYVVSAENIKKHIENLGLKEPNFEIRDIKTAKLTKKMVDNGTSSYQLIEDSVKNYINENIISFIDIDASLDASLISEYSNVYQDFQNIGNYADLGHVKRDEFLNEKNFIDAFKKDNPVKLEDLIKDIRENGFKRNRNNAKGSVEINFKSFPSYVTWLENYRKHLESEINKKAKSNISVEYSNKINELVKSTVRFSNNKKDLLNIINLDLITKKFGDPSINKEIFNYILLKNPLEYLDKCFAKRIPAYNATDKIAKDNNKEIEDTLQNINTPESLKILELIRNNNIGLADFYKEILKVQTEQIKKRIKAKPEENLYAFVRDSNILKEQYPEHLSKIKELLKDESIKKSFRNYIFKQIKTELTEKATNLDSEKSKIVGNEFLDAKIKESADKFYEDDFAIYIYEYKVRSFVYALLKTKQMESGLKKSITFEEEFYIIKEKLSPEFRKKAENIFAKMTIMEKSKILPDNYILTTEDFQTSYCKSYLKFFDIQEKYMTPGGYETEYAELDLEDNSRKNKEPLTLSHDIISASRELACFKMLDKKDKDIEVTEKEQAKKAKEDAARKSELSRNNLEKNIKTVSKELVSEILAMSKDLPSDGGYNITIKEINKSRNAKEITYYFPVSEIDPTAKHGIIRWTAEDLLREKKDPTHRNGKVSEIYTGTIKDDKNMYDVNFNVEFAGQIIFCGTITVMVINENLLVPSDIYKKNNYSTITSAIEFVIDNNTCGYNFNVLCNTKYFKKNLREFLLGKLKEKYNIEKSNSLIKLFPTSVSISEIDEKYNSNIFAIILQDSIKSAFNKANPLVQTRNPADPANVLETLSVAISAQNGSAFNMEVFAQNLPFDDKIKAYIAKDVDLKAVYNVIMRKKSAQAMVRAQAQFDRENNYQNEYQRRVHNQGEQLAISMFDSSDEYSISMLATISKAIEAIAKEECISDAKILEEINVEGVITTEKIQHPNYPKNKIYVQKIKFSNKTPNIVKRLFENMKINPNFSRVNYYGSPIDAVFKASFKIEKDKKMGFLLPKVILK